MEKKIYIKPKMENAAIIQQFELLGASKFNSNAGDGTITGNSGNARSRDFDWEDEDDELFMDW